MLQFKRTSSDNPDFQKLIIILDEYLKILDGDDHEFYSNLNKVDAIVNVIVCYDDEVAVGCGAFKVYDKIAVEIKRMFVLKEYRGKGIASKIMSELELWAQQLKFNKTILETGNKQLEAISLYEKLGYTIISNYGKYDGVENSICMMKSIKQL